METFRVLLNCIDHYQATPTEFDPPVPFGNGISTRNTKPKVPVIRAFGSTETGQRVCAHIHGAFPYIYIEYRGSLGTDEVKNAISELHSSIDRALANSYRQNAYDGKIAYVAHISLVKGIPFYGFHVGYRFYFKIYLLNPLNSSRLADLLRQGAVMKRSLQPYESHMQYIPQWMCDYNLYGCAYMDCEKVKFRSPVPDFLELSNLDHRWHDRSIPKENISNEMTLPKQSYCALEVDVCVQDIANRHAIQERPLHHDFIERNHPISTEERLVHSMAGLWQDEIKRRKRKMGLQDTDSSSFLAEELVSMSASQRDQAKAGWIHEEEFHEKLLNLVKEEAKDPTEPISFDNFVKKDASENAVPSALASVEDLYPQKLEPRNTEMYIEQLEADIDEDAIDDTIRGNDFDDANEYDDISEDLRTEYVDTVDVPIEDFPSSAFQTDDDLADLPTDQTVKNDEPRKSFFSLGEDKAQNEKYIDVLAKPSIRSHKRAETDDISDAHVKKRTKCVAIDSINEPSVSRGDDSFSSFDIAAALEEDDKNNGRIGPDDTPAISSQGEFMSSQKTARGKTASRTQRLPFPVVKNPNDPHTLSCFSQRSGASKETSQLSQATHSQDWSDDHTLHEKPSSEQQPKSSDAIPSQNSQLESLAANIYDAFDIPKDRRVLCYRYLCPSPSEIAATIDHDGRPAMIYQQAYYSDESDVPDRQREYAGREFRLVSDKMRFLPEFNRQGVPHLYTERPSLVDPEQQRKTDQRLRELSSAKVWEFARLPPTRVEVIEWLENERQAQQKNTSTPIARRIPMKPNLLSQIEGATQKDPHGFKYSQNRATTSVKHRTQYMSVMSLEIHVNSRDNLVPDPEEDEISCIFWSLQSDDEELALDDHHDGMLMGIIHQPGHVLEPLTRALNIEVQTEASELDLMTHLVDIVRSFDPDILTGYEVHNSSWGYVLERARLKYEYNLCDELSRVKSHSHGKFGKENDRWGFNNTSTVTVTGRHMINIWRAMKSELTLLGYAMENVVYHLLHRRIPHYPFKDLTKWYTGGKPREVMKVIDYFLSRTRMDLEILDSNELIPRTSEQARLLGVDFYSVFARGSQFKVESLMFRIAKPENFILISPSRKQVAQQNALECLPLVMEPQSDFYTSPVLVLDFQSLYPSIIIAYNYCYSTFLGRLVSWRGRNKMGVTDYERDRRLLELLQDDINIAPNGMMYVKPGIRRSLMARMLSEILETRVMVKGGMKADKDDKNLQRLLNHRQLALKLIANVTYGYTSASFSGRMPCSEIADSIVQTARETLERAIAFIHSVERWDAEVVYGDTDSLFVHLKGRTRDQAFTIGEEISKAVTKMNPRPIKLKFEKVYHPCVLLAKKRYVGFKYEHRDQVEPEFDAKGIETVRRDGTPAEQKIEEKALKVLFRTADLSQVKSYFQKQCSKIMQGRVSIQDFCFAREVRLGTYSEKGTMPAGALVSTRKMMEDHRQEPQYGERVPYVVVSGAPGARLIDRCVAPEELLNNSHLELDAEYYITKNLIPPLERIFNLVGANVRQWYDEMPKIQRIRRIEGAFTGLGRDNGMSKKTLESYMKSSSCILCKDKLQDACLPLCTACASQPHVSLFKLTSRLQQAERRTTNLQKICRSCMGAAFGEEVVCDSKECSVFYSRTREMSKLKSSNAVLGPVIEYLERESERVLEW
ncbi:DNA polymerase zeta subunit [Talaromyces islandicus]|uniref:DNA polymerase n=1 Tax=Talaromyces islandicus TaxID=28573 RepID=A0A0U1LIS5_TALIS|nr:DNA polymerase zeta subunit [Talaromyces islandicus]